MGVGGWQGLVSLRRDSSSFPAASHSLPLHSLRSHLTLPARQPTFTVGLAPLSPQPRVPAWLTPCSRPTLGCTTTQVSLGATRPGGFEGPQKVIGRFGGGGVRLCAEESDPPFAHPWTQYDLSRGEGYCALAELVKGGQADGALIGGGSWGSLPTPTSVSSSLSVGLCPSEHNFSPAAFRPAPAAKRR